MLFPYFLDDFKCIHLLFSEIFGCFYDLSAGNGQDKTHLGTALKEPDKCCSFLVFAVP
jgi:hypothetical protein